MEKQSYITPRKLQGFWELMPKEQQCFSMVLNKIESAFKQNCFMPLDTPVLEYSDVLLAKSGGETDKQVFRFCKGDTDMCMRYDLTVPLARFVAMHKNELEFPFKRYQIGKVYRGERPQKGRFREFYQCDADIIGNETLSMVADAECISMFEKCFDALKLDVQIKISNRKILAGLIEEFSMQSKNSDIMIVLDKLDKISVEAAMQELESIGLKAEQSTKLIEVTKTCGTVDEIIKKLEKLSQNPTFLLGLEELKQLDGYLKNFGCTKTTYNLAVIRGHNYYTGTVFEGFIANHAGAIGGGGRFENLCGYFTDKTMPGVGMSIGVTRLFDFLLEDGYFNLQASILDVAIINFDETLPDALEIVNALRQVGIKAECFYENKSFKSKMKEANRRGVKFVVIVGQEEVEKQIYTLKDMQTGLQQNLSLKDIAKEIIKCKVEPKQSV